jgi:hypothetical protein
MSEQERIHPLRPFLKNWVWEHGRIGTRYLDCLDGQIKFDEGKKSRFAAETYLYVPLEADSAVTSPDSPTNPANPIGVTGPIVQEARLARLLRAAQLGRPEEAGSVLDVQRSVQDCIELALFSAYQFEARRAEAAYAQEAMFDDEIRAAVVADIRRIYAPLRAQLALYDYTVLHGLPNPLVIDEAPFIDWRTATVPGQPFVSMPLGPYSLLVGGPSGRQSRAGPVVWKNAVNMGPLKNHNQVLGQRTRLWLAATSDDQLLGVQARFLPEAT